jgi:hypothetical protein
VRPSNSIREESGPVGRRRRFLPDRHREAAGARLWRANQQVGHPANVTPHNAHAGPCEALLGTDQKHGPRRKALAHSPKVVRTLSPKAITTLSPSRAGRGIFLSGAAARGGFAGGWIPSLWMCYVQIGNRNGRNTDGVHMVDRMCNMIRISHFICVLAVGPLLCAVAFPAFGDPSLPGFSIEQYSSVPYPQQVSVAPSGVLFVGNGTNAPDYPAVKVHRIMSDDQPAEEYGFTGLRDPDGVVVDSHGSITGAPGSLLVGSYAGGGRGQVAAISPDGTVTVLWGPTSAFTNINSLIFDSTHRLLFIDADVKRVFASSGGFPSALFNLANSPASIAVDAIDHIYTSDITGTIAVHAADGSLINSALATGLGTWPVLLRGPCGSAWEDVLYAINYDTGDFIRIDTNGVQTTIGSGFQGASWATFGPDCALYVTVPGKILRIVPSTSTSPVIPGLSAEIFASLPFPQQLSFGHDDNLFVGNGENHPNFPPVRIRRVGYRGSPVEEYGNTPISDPDGIQVDRLGAITGVAGAVLVGAYAGNGSGQISAIYPDETVSVLWPPSALLGNPNTLLFDSTNRLIILSMEGHVLSTTGSTPTVLFSEPNILASMAIDSADRIYTATTSGTISVHSSDGSPINSNLVSGLGAWPVLFHGSCGSAWGDFLYATNSNTGELLRIDDSGVATAVGTGFQGAGWATFGPDCSLYVSFPQRIERFWSPASSVLETDSPLHGGLLVTPMPARSGQKLEIRLSLASPELVRLDLYSVSGRLCSSYAAGVLPSGTHAISWSPKGPSGPLASGVYFLCATSGSERAVQKIVLLN